MTLTREESVFLWVLVFNLVLAVIYLLYGMFFAEKSDTDEGEKEENVSRSSRRTYLLQFIILVLCPVIGFVFFFLAKLLEKTIFRFGVNLDDVIFSKDRVDTQVKADEEQGRNIIPIEEALIVNDKKSLRTAMLSIIRGEVQGSLSSIALALDSGDSETAHYAASVLSDKLNEFRINVRKRYSEVLEESGEPGREEALLAYMDSFLKQNIFTQLEQNGYVRMMAEIADTIYERDPSRLTAELYEGVCLRLMESEEFEASEKWCLRLAQQHPEALCAYTCRLKLYFILKNRKAFLQMLRVLKKADVVIDSETLEIIRIFS